MEKKICFKDLSKPLKVLIVLAWIEIGFNLLFFGIGFILGVIKGIGGL